MYQKSKLNDYLFSKTILSTLKIPNDGHLLQSATSCIAQVLSATLKWSGEGHVRGNTNPSEHA